MIVLDDISRRSLVTSRLLFSQAVLFAERGSVADSILAVVTLDLANETVLGLAISSLDSSTESPDRRPYPQKVQRLADILGARGFAFPYKPQILRVHDIRNDAQHRAKYPTADELNECRFHTHEFLSDFVRLVWNVNFGQIRLADLVRHEDARRLLSEAEDAISEDRYVEATRLAATAFETAIAKTEEHLVGSFPWGFSGPRVPQLLEREISNVDMYKFSSTLEQIRATVLSLSLRINPLELARYRELAGYPRLMASGKISAGSKIHDIQPSDAQWVLNMCVDSILRAEQTVGDLDTPFGKNLWS